MMKLQNSLFNIELTHLGCLNLQSTVYGCTYISAEKKLRTQKRQRLEEREESFTSSWDDEKLRIEEEEEEEDIREDLWLERESSAALTLQIAILIVS